MKSKKIAVISDSVREQFKKDFAKAVRAGDLPFIKRMLKEAGYGKSKATIFDCENGDIRLFVDFISSKGYDDIKMNGQVQCEIPEELKETFDSDEGFSFFDIEISITFIKGITRSYSDTYAIDFDPEIALQIYKNKLNGKP